MNTLNNEQIAREAAEKLSGKYGAYGVNQDIVEKIILAAIERATHLQRSDEPSLLLKDLQTHGLNLKYPPGGSATIEQRVTELERRTRRDWDEILKLWKEIGYKNPK